MKNKAVFQKDCVAKHNKFKLGRKQKKLFEKEHEAEQGMIETNECLESTETQRKLTRSSIRLKNFTPICFFCDEHDSDMKMHMCQTFQVQQKIEEITQEKYHFRCLAAYYNKVRNKQPSSDIQKENEVITKGNGKYQCYNEAIYIADIYLSPFDLIG